MEEQSSEFLMNALEQETNIVREHRITVICGHYGCGKTNLALNLAIMAAKHGETVALADMDVVNPYFRSSEYGELLKHSNVRLMAPLFANSTLDVPALPPDVHTIFADSKMTAFLDAGGDDVGITALAGLHNEIKAAGYQMYYVINHYRLRSESPRETVALMREIEKASKLHVTGIINNSNLGVETTANTIIKALHYAEETASLAGLPFLYSTVPDCVARELYQALCMIQDSAGVKNRFKVVQRLVKFPWE